MLRRLGTAFYLHLPAQWKRVYDHSHRKKHKVESRFLGETADWDSMILLWGMGGSYTRLYKDNTCHRN